MRKTLLAAVLPASLTTAPAFGGDGDGDPGQGIEGRLGEVIRKILEHLKVREESEPRPPPAVPEEAALRYVPVFDS